MIQPSPNPDTMDASGYRAGTPRLLVSVREDREISLALQNDVDILDLKEPRRGPLSPSSVALWRTALSLRQRRSEQQAGTPPPLSAALGECDEALGCAESLPGEFDFAKVGPSECDTPARLRRLWDDVRQRLHQRVELVAVAYADYEQARCLPPEDVFRLAHQSGLRRCLIDTFTKRGKTTADHLGIERLLGLSKQLEQVGIWWTLAGSIHLALARQLWDDGVSPDCIGVRGDVCEGGRRGPLSQQRIAQWCETLPSWKPYEQDSQREAMDGLESSGLNRPSQAPSY